MKILKISGLVLLILIAVLIIGTMLVTHLVPSFGNTPDREKKSAYSQSAHFDGEVFINEIPTSMDLSFSSVISVLKDYMAGIPDQKPVDPLPILQPDKSKYADPHDSITQITWFGHSAFLLQTRGLNILLDPMLGLSPSPFPSMGSQRFTAGLPISLDELPKIDVVVISHDHYDHLDYPTLIKLKDKIKRFIVPLGVESHLISWGFDPEQITSLDWWQETNNAQTKFISTPARHFSGRGVTDRNSTLWSSWIIQSEDINIYFSGDGGYGPHFKDIGEKFGPFDLALMECGQYDPRWEQIHMMPEETVQAAKDVRAEVFAPIHWGAFVLALHSWYDPVDRAAAASQKHDMNMITPKIGEIVNVSGDANYTQDRWWESLK